MPQIITNLWFDGNALEAAEFYVSIFPNSRVTATIGRNEAIPGDDADAPVTVDFELDGQPFTGINGGPGFPFTEAISLLIECADQAEIDHYWDALLADGGEPGRCGWLKDRFGVSWQVVSPRLVQLLGDPDPDRARRAFEAMYPMSKIDLGVVEAAAGQS
jgi:predicted 3-demethylubiquinone-9 3-methyltransferase (glyoxalase superfamily)